MENGETFYSGKEPKKVMRRIGIRVEFEEEDAEF